MACVRTHKSAEPGSVLIRMDRRDRSAMIGESPNLYYAPPHYQDYDAVLVRLDQLNPELLRDLLIMAHKFVTIKSPADQSRVSIIPDKRRLSSFSSATRHTEPANRRG